MRLLLVRHGESLGNVTQVLQGRDDPLTDRGRRQAGEIAAHLATSHNVRAIYASPLARAYETAQIIGARIGIDPQPREGLAEINVGSAVGLTFENWTARFPDEARRFRTQGIDYTFPEGESGRQLGARIAADLDRIVAAHAGGDDTVIVVSHGGALAWALHHLLEETSDSWPRYDFHNCSLTEVMIEPATQEVMVVCRNEIGHLSPEPTEEVATG